MSGREDLAERFRDLSSSQPLNLWEGALLVAALVDPGEDLARANVEIERLAARVRQAGGGSPTHEALVRVLFSEENLRGDSEAYDDPANSSVVRVLEKKSGMPITLSIVTIEAGRRAGLRLTGIGLPGHFVVGGSDLPEGLFLDPYNGGRILDAEALADQVSAIFGSPIALPAEAFAPDSPRAILIRMLLNLRRSWERREQFEESLAALACAQALAPEDVSLLRERGLLLLRAGRSEEALAALDSYAQVASGEDAEAVAKLTAIVREGLAVPQGELVAIERPPKKIFTLEQAREVLPKVRNLTSDAVARYVRLAQGSASEEERRTIVREWMRQIASLGAEIKGLWLVDFDSGGGYYCWKYPEPALDYFHGYEEGFGGRLPLQ